MSIILGASMITLTMTLTTTFKKVGLFVSLYFVFQGLSFDVNATQIPVTDNKLDSVQLSLAPASNVQIEIRPLSHVQLAEKHFLMGIKLSRNGQHAAAADQFSESLQYDETNPSIVVALAKSHFALSKYSTDIERLTKSLQLYPNSRTLYTQLAHHYTNLNKFTAVVSVLSNRPGATGTNETLSSLLAYAYVQTGQFRRATNIYNSLISRYPRGFAWKLGKALSLEGDGDNNKALQVYVGIKALKNIPNELSYFINTKIISLYEAKP